MATGTAVGPPSIAERMKRTGFWTKHRDTGQTRSLWASWPAVPAGTGAREDTGSRCIQRNCLRSLIMPRAAPVIPKQSTGAPAIDTRKWVLSKLLPKTYGNRVKLTGDLEVPPRNRMVIEFVHTQQPPPDTSNSLPPLNSSNRDVRRPRETNSFGM